MHWIKLFILLPIESDNIEEIESLSSNLAKLEVKLANSYEDSIFDENVADEITVHTNSASEGNLKVSKSEA